MTPNHVQSVNPKIVRELSVPFCGSSGITLCRLPERLAATYRKFGHMSKLACRAMRVTKRRNFAGISLASTKPYELPCGADASVFSCAAKLLVGNGQTFG